MVIGRVRKRNIKREKDRSYPRVSLGVWSDKTRIVRARIFSCSRSVLGIPERNGKLKRLERVRKARQDATAWRN